jgi:hypothetical protein
MLQHRPLLSVNALLPESSPVAVRTAASCFQTAGARRIFLQSSFEENFRKLGNISAAGSVFVGA